MKKKVYKYEQKKERIKKLFETPKEGEFIIISQLNSITSRKFDQLKKYGIEHKMMVEYLNLTKMKSVFEKNQEILKRLNNEIILIKGSNYAMEFQKIITFLEKEEIYNKGLLLLTILISENGKYREMSIESFKKKQLKVESKDAAMIELYKMLRGKLLSMELKLISILKKKEEQEKKKKE